MSTGTNKKSNDMEIVESEQQVAKNLGDMLNKAGGGGQGLVSLLDDHGGVSDFLRSLPANVKRRVRYLKRLQVDGIQLEVEFYRAVHELEIKFAPKFAALHTKRKSVVKGDYEPTDQEADFPLLHGLSDEEQKKLDDGGPPVEDAAATNGGDASNMATDTKGVPQFWLTVLKNVDMISEMIQEHDEPVLQYLVDIDVNIEDEPNPGFKLIFHFAPNEYFSNLTLTKHYTLQIKEDSQDPFEYDGPEIIACDGCKIDWKEGKNVTVKLIKKKQKHKGTGSTRFVTKQVKADSFFNFFDVPPNTPGHEDELDDETRVLLHQDFEVGQALRDRIIPRAALFYTGEAQDDEDYEDEEDEGDEDEDADDDNEESDN